MIWNFICCKCKEYKSHGKPDYLGRMVCLDCYYKKKKELNKNGKRTL